ncbi:PREDICTED: ubiquitin carboxyl-terminal hydrolase 18 isoform X2 [Theobroma cacao]|uniref:ubiquitinyl hydrolase 1 n=2 Tax=Theobroma cacao TaxID=3641 RepID=A0A061GJD3_THECC|nr:PREDICTED: ubiquitin carboxyl-terminal hydrolase 18 isoform X2 [Theobroma cacao]EOY29251.1 Ubiquitin carboxyl-terminal hydrolase 19, putative isoform 1 [Theobroma cacao]EOY29252.1 Ubiquitin carboxyl-terminal hydrolase 19, putative isoform 1 [Theobroma cacao]
MHVGGITVDLNWFLQFIFTLFIFALGALHLLKNTASKYFEVDANFDRDQTVPSMPMDPDLSPCAVCSNPASKKCSRCKSVRYCSSACQQVHWKAGHKTECKVKSAQTASTKPFLGVALVPASGTSKVIKKPRKVLFPYDEFVKLFNWEKPGFPPCGLLNCGNSCFANVVLQCLVSTRPLVAYLLEKGHRKECRRNDWCFMCEFQTHVERSSQSLHPFSPINILSRLPNIGGNLGYGRQEDAHEFMRFAIDTMQSVCLDEFGGEKAVDPSSQETTLIQHIFGGHLQSQVFCTNCDKISSQYENMMDLTVEIHGDASSLEECLDQFTVKEWLHGDNMYKCDGCNDYVKAWKRLSVRWAPNVLTIALKRFQSGRFGKLNKRVSFPETLDLTPYMSEDGDDSNVYKLYAVVVHLDMLNASFFGHYICYIKDFCGNWYRIDDCKVTRVESEEVLSQGAYMLLYSRVSARPSCLRTSGTQRMDEQKPMKAELEHCPKEQIECVPGKDSVNSRNHSASLSLNGSLHSEIPRHGVESSTGMNGDAFHGRKDGDVVKSNSSLSKEVSICSNESPFQIDSKGSRVNGADMDRVDSTTVRENPENMDTNSAQPCSDTKKVPSCDKDLVVAASSEAVREHPESTKMVEMEQYLSVTREIKSCEQDSQVTIDYVMEDSEDISMADSKPSASIAGDSSSNFSFSDDTSPATRTSGVKRELSLQHERGNGIKRAEIADGSQQ